MHRSLLLTVGLIWQVMSGLGTNLTQEEAQTLIALVDHKGRGCVDLEDFSKFFAEVCRHRFSKVLCVGPAYCKGTTALTFQNVACVLQRPSLPGPALASRLRVAI
jgi:hypothetical protein